MSVSGAVNFDVRDDAVEVVMTGSIDYAVVDSISDADLAEYESRSVLVRMAEVTFMDSLGLSLLLRLRNHAGSVTLVDVQPEVRRLLELTGLLDAFPMRSSTDPVH